MNCDKRCEVCPYPDCINDAMDAADYAESRERDRKLGTHHRTKRESKAVLAAMTPEERAERKKALCRMYYQRNREERLAYQKAYREAHLEERKAYRRRYYQEHIEQERERQRRWKRKRAKPRDYAPMTEVEKAQRKRERAHAYYERNREKIIAKSLERYRRMREEMRV